MGISVDDPIDTLKWAIDIGITFPLLADRAGKVAKTFGLFDAKTRAAAKAVAVVIDSKLVFSRKVTSTEVPLEILPWIERLPSKRA